MQVRARSGMVTCLFLKPCVKAPVSKLSLTHLSPTDPLFCCCPKKTVRCHSAAEYRLHCSPFCLSHPHHQGDWGLNETARPFTSGTCRPSSHIHLMYYPTVVRAALSTPGHHLETKPSFLRPRRIITRLTVYICSQGIDPNFTNRSFASTLLALCV